MLEESINEKFASNSIDFGAPILGVMSGGSLIMGDPIPPPTATTNYRHGPPSNDRGKDYAVRDGEHNMWDDLSEEVEESEEHNVSIEIKIDNSTSTYVDHGGLKYPVLAMIVICTILIVALLVILYKFACKKPERKEVYKMPAVTEQTLQSVHDGAVNDTQT